MVFTIDLIEGNSHIGVPVFSSSAKKENKNYMVFSQPKQPKKLAEQAEEEAAHETNVIMGGAAINSQDRLQILNRIKELEKHREQIAALQQQQQFGAKSSPRNLPMGSTDKAKGSGAGKWTKHNLLSSVSPQTVKHHLHNRTSTNFHHPLQDFLQYKPHGKETFAFGAVTRDHYYSVHGEKRTMPKNGNYYPRFDIVERRVSGPVYGERKNLRRAWQARQKIEHLRHEQFEQDQICSKVVKILDESKVTQTSQQFWNKSRLSGGRTGSIPGANNNPTEDHLLNHVHFSNGGDGGSIHGGGNDHTISHSNIMNKSAAALTAHHESSAQGLNAATMAVSNSVGNTNDLALKTSIGFSSIGTDIKFSFSNQPLIGKYSLVNTYPERVVVRDEVPPLTEQIAPRTYATEFFRKQERPPFVTEKDPPNEHRFNPTEALINFNTINQLTYRGQKAVDIGRVSGRDELLIMKGGEAGRDLTANIAPNYEPNKELVLPQTSRPVPDFRKKTKRTLHGSIYRQEHSPDFYDSKRVSNGFHKQSQIVHPKAFVDIGKQHKRDMSLYYRHNNEALRNIERENMRQDFIKKLLAEEIVM